MPKTSQALNPVLDSGRTARRDLPLARDRQLVEDLRDALARVQFPTPIVIGPAAIALEAERHGLTEKW